MSLKEPQPESGFVLTLNQMGHMTSNPDIYNQAFIKYSTQVKNRYVLDIGAAYGASTLPCLRGGARVVANDLSFDHLKILKRKTSKSLLKNLELLPDHFPNEIKLGDKSFDAILISRVLHFLTGDEITLSFQKLFTALKVGGKVFVVVSTPYNNNFKSFIPVFEERKKNKEKWPGIIESSSIYFPHRKNQFPEYLNLFDQEILIRELNQSGFLVEKISYFSSDLMPQDINLDGREYVGAIAVKKND